VNIINQLEIVVSKEEKEFKATCPVFPRCYGYGETEKEALKNLSQSIAKFIGKVAKKVFSQVLDSNRFTEVILDVAKKNKEQRYIFNLDPQAKNSNMPFMANVKPSININEMMSYKLPTNKFNDINEFFTSDEISTHNIGTANHLLTLLGKHNEGIGFGFPISFN
jgi:predicted RNase H-like HicB family nuclease